MTNTIYNKQKVTFENHPLKNGWLWEHEYNYHFDNYRRIILNNWLNIRVKYKTQKHHIFPTCLQPNREPLNEKWNLVHLSIEEHKVAHKYISDAFPANLSLLNAKNLMFAKSLFCDPNFHIEVAKINKGRTKETHEGTARQAEYMRNRTISEESKLKMSLSKLGKPLSEEHCKNLRKPQKKVTCPHCGKLGGKATMPRWHFDNCKQKPNNLNK